MVALITLSKILPSDGNHNRHPSVGPSVRPVVCEVKRATPIATKERCLIVTADCCAARSCAASNRYQTVVRDSSFECQSHNCVDMVCVAPGWCDGR